MAFTPKDWKDYPDQSTPLTAAALVDMETRLSDYADAAAIIPAGDALPGGPRTEGEQFDLRFSHDGLYRRCTWRGALNGGNGAWAVGSPPVIINQTAQGDRTDPGGLPNMPTWKTPYVGIYSTAVHGSLRISANAAPSDCYVSLALNGSPVPSNVTGITGGTQWHGSVVSGQEGHRSINAGVDIGLYVRVNSGTATWRFGDLRPWHAMIHIIELRP